MSDRTMLAVGVNKLLVPRMVKRALQAAVGAALTAGVVLVIVVGNGMLLGRGGSVQGFNAWLRFILRSDVLGMMLLTALVTTLYLAWERGREKG
jgi:hypothetical protein